jgi:mono/diheme cytochrome c family protein
VVCVVAATSAAVVLATAAEASMAPPRGPQRLAETGLYSDFASRQVNPRNLRYVPQYPLWSDGAAKARWIYLPPGSHIDAADPDRWVFPVGTKIWKEFAWSRPIETRMMERTRRGWVYRAYVWNAAGTDAVLAPEAGVVSSQEVAPGRHHRIPSVADCVTCHRGGRSEVLGFGALELSPDRDPLAPHAERTAPGDVDLPTLVQRRLVRRLPSRLLEQPPRIVAETPAGRAAMGYLHANCGNCHDSAGPLAPVGLDLRHLVGAPPGAQEPALRAIARPSRFQVPGPSRHATAWISPGDPALSSVVARMASRNPVAQMPPLGTQVVDEEALSIIRRWIEQDVHGPPPEPPAASSSRKTRSAR